jgi:GDP/UDP-N,N'-diacetylbacillosamine 2-epimerase (hydrolysing)
VKKSHLRLLFLTGSRGEWGYIRPILRLCQQSGIAYSVCATNMHLLATYGLSINDIRADGFEISDEIYMSLEGHNHYTMTKSLGVFLSSFADVLGRIRPDWLILAGDRGEQMAGAIAGGYTYTPIAHIQAGELSGNIDGPARHAIDKFAHLHFASNQDATDRLIRLGEEPFRVKLVGAPQLDELVLGLYTSVKNLSEKFDLDFRQPFLLVVQHSVTEEYDQTESQIRATLEALEEFRMMKVWIFPNNDAGCSFIRTELLQRRTQDIIIFENLKREDYLGMLKACRAIVGNSSSGLLEAPTFQTPAVNLGNRQANRLRGKNVIQAPFQIEAIRKAVHRAVEPAFRASLKETTNPYGDGHSSARILEILRETPIDSKLLTKRLTY